MPEEIKNGNVPVVQLMDNAEQKIVESLTFTQPRIMVCTTFANRHWDGHAAEMVRRFDAFWPKQVALYVELDDKTLMDTLAPVISNHGGGIGTFDDDKRYQEFKAKYEDLDHPSDYRKQFFRFAHKIFALNDAVVLAKEMACDYLIWLDADVWTEKPVTLEQLQAWLPGADEVASYLGRKDWPHSECGFMAFNLKNRGDGFVTDLMNFYCNKDGHAEGLGKEQLDDSWFFDLQRKRWQLELNHKFCNLTEGVAGMNVWEGSPLAPFMTHHKGPVAKVQLKEKAPTFNKNPATQGSLGTKPLDIRIKNCLPHEEIRRNVSDNLALIPRWIPECQPVEEVVVFASGGPGLDMERLRQYDRLGYRIVCVKHSLERILAAGIVPWACVLLDPRVHVEQFVQNPDPRVNYFVASMVDPKVLMRLLENKCPVWGYHAAVGADEQQYVARGTPYVNYGSASAVRGLFVLKALGFSRFILLGYDLCHFTKPDLNEKLPDGNKKYLEVALQQPSWGGVQAVRTFWSEGQLLAQAQEIERIANDKMLEITAEGNGIVPWMLEHKKRYKTWSKTVYSPHGARRPAADAVVKGFPWHKRLISWIRTRTSSR